MHVFRFDCEWDIGINHKLWKDADKMEQDIRAALLDCGIDDDFEELEADGYINMEMVEVVE